MRNPITLYSTGLAACTLAAVACSAAIGDGTGGSGNAGTSGSAMPGANSSGSSGGVPGSSGSGGSSGAIASSGSGGVSPVPVGDPTTAGQMVLRHLTQLEYLNTVRDLLGDTSTLAADVPGEPAIGTFDTFPFREPATVGATEARGYQQVAESLAGKIAAKLSTILPCSPTAGNAASETACATSFVNAFGARAFRRPVSPVEASGLVGLYQAARTTIGLDFGGAIGLLVEQILQSPGFLYHWELGPTPTVHDGPAVQLDGYALANRLSYFLWSTMPDQALLDAASKSQLATADQVTVQAKRLLQDPKARVAIQNFFEQLLQGNDIFVKPKDQNVYPSWGPPLQAAMDAEFRTFFSSTVVDGSALFADLFTSNKTVVNQSLASVYGLKGITGSQMQPVTLDASQRAGFLTMPAFLAVNGNVDNSQAIYRGHSVYMQLLCHDLTPPMNVVVPVPAPPTPGQTARQRFAAHSLAQCATGCHNLMDPYGFAFEHYDGIGQYRTTDNGSQVDSTTTVKVDNKDVAVSDGVQLARILAKSDEARQCFTTQWVRYAVARPETPADVASISAAHTAFSNSQYNVRDLLVAVATARTFRYRTPALGEMLP